MNNVHEIDKLVGEINNLVNLVRDIRPQSKILIESTQMLLDQEIVRGARKSYLARLYKSTISDARELFSSQQFAALQAGLGNAGESSTVAIEKALEKGLIGSAVAFRAVMSELDRFLSDRSELNSEEVEMVNAVNKLLAEFEAKKSK